MSTTCTPPEYNKYDFLVKTVLIGDTGVGKTCLLKRFASMQFPESHLTTIGVDFEICTLNLKGKIAKLQIWDTAGQERFRNITTSYYRGANAIMLCFDVTDRRSFNNIRSWLSEVDMYATDDTKIILVANKVDKIRERDVTSEECQELAKSLGLVCVEASAKSNANVEQAFQTIVTEYVDHRSKKLKQRVQPYDHPFTLTDAEPVKEKFNCCTIL